MSARRSTFVAACAAATLAGAAAPGLTARAAPPTAQTAQTAASVSASTTTLTPVDLARATLARMTTAQRVGQLFMVGGPATGLGSATESAITRYHVGNLVLTGRTTSGTAPVRALTAHADALTTSAATAGVPLFIAADQEGGYVQVLQGPGFSRMPTALTQGSWSDATLTANATTWGWQVLRSGVDLDLAPVMDTVAKSFTSSNLPIGYYQREFGYTPSVVADKGTSFQRGLQVSGLATTPKHFPGLGRVTGNTDTSAGVTDTVTTRTSADLAPFRAALAAHARVLMVSSAYYRLIDAAHPAVFSPTVIGGMIRHDLGFTGIVVSDDLGNARQVTGWTPAARAVHFIEAGGDVVLTVNPTVVPAMVSAVTSKAATDSAFRSKVDAAALRVLTVKAQDGLLAPRPPVNGVLGASTVVALQRWLGITRSGVFDTATIRALQARIGMTVVGIWGPRSMATMQSYLGISRDGATSWNARTVAQLQRYLATQL